MYTTNYQIRVWMPLPTNNESTAAPSTSPVTPTPASASVRQDVAYLEEYTWRWKNHLQMLETVAQSNIDPETVQRWRHQIHACFREKLAAKL